MERYALMIGTRDEILAELDSLGRDNSGPGRDHKAPPIAAAWNQINDGADKARVGHRIYLVQTPEDTADALTWERFFLNPRELRHVEDGQSTDRGVALA
jgi:hypothetical protein